VQMYLEENGSKNSFLHTGFEIWNVYKRIYKYIYIYEVFQSDHFKVNYYLKETDLLNLGFKQDGRSKKVLKNRTQLFQINVTLFVLQKNKSLNSRTGSNTAFCKIFC
jgi:hypothetical protein